MSGVAALRPDATRTRMHLAVEGGGTIVLVRNAQSQSGRITGPGLTAFWDEPPLARFEFVVDGAGVRFLAVRNDGRRVLLGTSTVDALGRDGWYLLAAALGAFYDGGVTVVERDVTW